MNQKKALQSESDELVEKVDLRKDRLTRIHQWVTVAAVPAGLGIAGWFGVSFIQMREDISTALSGVTEIRCMLAQAGIGVTTAPCTFRVTKENEP